MRAIIVVFLTTAVGCAIPSSQYSRTVSQTVETNPLLSLDLSTFNGSVSVETHELPTVDMEITYTGYGSTEKAAEENCERLDCEIEANDGMLTVRAVKPSDQWMGSASFKLKVPPDCALKLQTSNGRVSAVNVQASIEVRTSNGKIELKNIEGDIFAKTSNGTIDAANCLGKVNLSTSNGKVYYAGVLLGSENEIQTSNGKVNLKFPADSLTEVATKTSNGSITCELPTQRILDEGKRSFHAIVGQGDLDNFDSKISVRTSNGSIRIEPLEEQHEETEEIHFSDTGVAEL